MDLLFSKYASPFLLLDGLILTGRFEDFIDEFVRLENEKVKWEFYLHKVQDKSFAEFKADIEPIKNFSPEDIETTVTESQNILNSFKPED